MNEKLKAERAALVTEFEALIDDDGTAPEARVEAIEKEIADIDTRIERGVKLDEVREAAKDPANVVSNASAVRVPASDLDPWRGDAFATGADWNNRAHAAIEQWAVEDGAKEAATRGVEGLDPKFGGREAAAHLVRTSDPHYVSAFQKWVRDPTGFQADLDDEERAAWRNVREYSTEVRALTTAGAVLPSPLDPAIILTNAGSDNPMRRLARVESTGSDHKRFIVSTGVTASFDAEASEVSDDTPTLDEITVNVESARAFVAGSIEAVSDQPDFAAEVGKMFADAKDRLESDKFITGTGSNEPKGIEVALTGTASEVDAAGEDVIADDVYGLVAALDPRWRANATFQSELSLIQKLFRDFNPSGTEPPMIEGDKLTMVPYALNSAIDPYSDIDPAASATHRPLIIGDWKQFLILDRWGGIVEFIPHLFHTANNLPSGQRGFFYHWRTGSEVATINAFRMLKVITTA